MRRLYPIPLFLFVALVHCLGVPKPILIRSIPTESYRASSIVLSADGSCYGIIANVPRGNDQIWYLSNDDKLFQMWKNTSSIRALSLAPDGSRYYFSDTENGVCAGDPDSDPHKAWTIKPGSGRSWARNRVLAISPKGDRMIAALSGDGRTQAALYDTAKNGFITLLEGSRKADLAVYSKWGQYATVIETSNALVYKTDGTLVADIDVGSPITSGALSPNGKQIVLGTLGKAVLYDVATKKLLQTYPSSNKKTEVERVTISPNGQMIAATVGEEIRIWHVRTATLLFAWKPARDYYFTALAFSANSEHFYTGEGNSKGMNNFIRRWSLRASQGKEAQGLNIWSWENVKHYLERDDEAAVMYLKDVDPSLNYLFNGEQSFLFLAVSQNKLNVVKKLLERGADAELGDTLTGETPLMYAARKGMIDMARVLLAGGAKIGAKDLQGSGVGIKATDVDDPAILDFLVGKGLDLNARGVYGLTPLMLAAQTGKNKALAFLLARPGIERDLVNDEGFTALHLAVHVGNAEAVKALVTAGARTDIKDPQGRTPIDLAAAINRLDLVDLLIELGVEP